MAADLMTSGEAADILGVSYDVVATLVRSHGLAPRPIPRSPNSKGLDGRDLAVLRRALGLRKGEKVPRRPRPVRA